MGILVFAPMIHRFSFLVACEEEAILTDQQVWRSLSSEPAEVKPRGSSPEQLAGLAVGASPRTRRQRQAVTAF